MRTAAEVCVKCLWPDLFSKVVTGVPDCKGLVTWCKSCENLLFFCSAGQTLHDADIQTDYFNLCGEMRATPVNRVSSDQRAGLTHVSVVQFGSDLLLRNYNAANPFSLARTDSYLHFLQQNGRRSSRVFSYVHNRNQLNSTPFKWYEKIIKKMLQ